jgi:hypothetical protein
MLGVIDALIWPKLRIEIEVTAVRPPRRKLIPQATGQDPSS